MVLVLVPLYLKYLIFAIHIFKTLKCVNTNIFLNKSRKSVFSFLCVKTHFSNKSAIYGNVTNNKLMIFMALIATYPQDVETHHPRAHDITQSKWNNYHCRKQ